MGGQERNTPQIGAEEAIDHSLVSGLFAFSSGQQWEEPQFPLASFPLQPVLPAFCFSEGGSQEADL